MSTSAADSVRRLLSGWTVCAGLALALGTVFLPSAQATTYLPSIKIGTAALISPSSANTYYYSKPGWTDTNNSDGLSAITGITTPIPPELVELVRALKSDPDLIYQYVANNIQTVWMYGLQKGALGAELDKSGTPFDQAELLVALLWQAGYSPKYVAGTVVLNQVQFSAWTGISDALAACQLLSSGGIPAQINGNAASTPCSAYSAGTAISTIRMAHIWVKATIAGSHSSGCSSNDVCVFDPSYKTYAWKTGIDLTLAMNFTHNGPLNAATTGGGYTQGTDGTYNTPWANSLNTGGTGGLNSVLQGYATNLLAYIQAQHLQGAQIEDIVSGGVVIPVATVIRQQALPYADLSPPYNAHTWTPSSRYNAIPDQYRTTLGVTGHMLIPDNSGNLNDTVMFSPVLFVDEIYGRTLTVDTDFTLQGIGNDQSKYYPNVVTFNLDHNLDGHGQLAMFTAHMPSSLADETARGLPSHIVLVADHPYAAMSGGAVGTDGTYMDATADKNVDLISALTIVHGWGNTSAALLSKWSDEIAHGQSLPKLITPPYCHQPPETCGAVYVQPTGDVEREKTAASWLAQFSRAAQLNAAIANAVPQLHHEIGFVYADVGTLQVAQRTQLDKPDWVENDNFDRIDVDGGISMTSKTADTTRRRAALQSLAAAGSTLEGSISAQMSDVPDTASTVSRFEWGNSPPSDHSAAGQNPKGIGPQNFYEFTTATGAAAANLVRVDGGTTGTATGLVNYGSPPAISQGEVNQRIAEVSGEIKAYTDAGFNVVASREAFLGPGQRGGAVIDAGLLYDHFPAKQRGGAFAATRYDANGELLEIAHIAIGEAVINGSTIATKGGGGGNEPNQTTNYNPSTAADILKTRFVDRSNALGVSLSNGSLAVPSPVSISNGTGGFPYELSVTFSWHPGILPTTAYGQIALTDPEPGWMGNWLNKLSLSSSGMEAMGAEDIRAAVGAIVAFYAAQDIYTAADLPQREAAAVLTNAWWAQQLFNNVATASIGANTRQFVKLANGQWIVPGTGFGSLSVTGTRTPFEQSCVNDLKIPYAMSRGWDESSMAFDVTNEHGDVEHFGYWKNTYGLSDDRPTCGVLKGFRLTRWTFLQGPSVTPVYTAQTDLPDALTEVDSSTGHNLTFNGTSVGGATHSITFSNASTLPAWMADAKGMQTSFAYIPGWSMTATQRPVPYSLLSTVTTPEHSTEPNVQYFYDTLGRVNQVKDAVAIQKGTRGPYNFYIADGTRGERDDPLSQRYTVVYDTYAHPSRYIDEMGIETDALFDSRGRAVRYVYPEGDCDAFAYDDHNNTTDFWKVDKTSACNTGAGTAHVLHASASWRQDWNKPITVTNARGNTTTLEYYENIPGKSLLFRATRPAIDIHGIPTTPIYTFVYDLMGKPTDVTGPTNIITHNEYQTNEDPKATTVDYSTGSGHLNLKTQFLYTLDGDPYMVFDPRGNTVVSTFDPNRRKTEDDYHIGNQFGLLDAVTNTVYDEVGRVKEVDAALCFDDVHTCPNSGVSVVTLVATQKTTYTPTSKVETVTDADNRTTTTTYDAGDRVLTVSDPILRKTHFVYCAAGNANCAANAIKTEHRAWVSGAACSQSPPSLQECYRRITYGTDGEMATIKDANANVTTYAYDGFSRLTKTTFPDTTYEQLGLDENGNVTSRTNRAGQNLTYQYNALDWMTQRVSPSPAATTTWTYMLDGNVDVLSDDVGTHNTIDYEYDTAGRMKSIATKIPGLANKTVVYTLDQNGNRIKLAWPSEDAAYSVGYCFDALNRMTAAMENTTTCGTSLLASYTYDALSRRTNLTYAGTGAQMQYTSYSDAGDLKTLTHQLAGSANDNTFNWDYTNAHQTNSMAATNSAWLWQPPANSSTAYSHNVLNQYTAIGSQTTGGSNCQGTVAQGLSYDCNGNLTFDGTYTFTYDAENRLLTANKTGLAATYQYDPLGRRTKKSGTGVTTTYFLSDGTDEIAEYDSSQVLTRRIIPGPAIDQPIAIQDVASGTKSFFHTDKQGSVVAMSDLTGALVEGPYTYDPYGNCFSGGSACGSSGEPYRFTGRRLDAETGCLYYRARYYCPDDKRGGRFLQTDPVGYSVDPNLYTYVGNDPTNKRDLMGLQPGDPYDTPDEAALDAVRSTNALSIQENAEYGGIVYKGANGKFYSQLPIRGSGDIIPRTYTGPKGSVYGDWHTHGDYSKYSRNGTIVRTTKHQDIFNSDHFSQHDKDIAAAGLEREKTPYKAYLGTPSNDAKIYDPATNTEITAPTTDNKRKAAAPSVQTTPSDATGVCSPKKGGCGPGPGIEDIWGQ